MNDPSGIPKFTDSERRPPPVSDLLSDDEPRPPLVVKLGDLWNDYVRGINVGRDPDAPPRAASSLPLLDDMKGILQWE